MDDQLDLIFSMLYAELKMQRRVGLQLSPAPIELVQLLSHRYCVPVFEEGLIVCSSALYALAMSLESIIDNEDGRDDRSLLVTFRQYAHAIVLAEDFRRKTNVASHSLATQ
jgi:hypothetical protein